MLNVTEIDVRYAETDQMGVVHHANYLVWFEIGRTNFMNDAGYNYSQLEKKGILAPVIDAQLTYYQPAMYGETVSIRTSLKKYNGIRMTYQYDVYKNETTRLVTGTTTHVIVKRDTFKPVMIRKIDRHWHERYKQLVSGVS